MALYVRKQYLIARGIRHEVARYESKTTA